jgi:hypothetical protein
MGSLLPLARGIAGIRCFVRRLDSLQNLSRVDLRALEENQDGERGSRSARTPRCHHTGFIKTRSAVHIFKG